MLYAILCYHSEAAVGAWTKEQDDAVLAKRAVVNKSSPRKRKDVIDR